MPVRLEDFQQAFNDLGLDRQPVIAHASLSAFGDVEGGAEMVVEALLGSFDAVIMPAFTYKTMLIPRTGPPHNGIVYGSGEAKNRMAEFFSSEMPVDPMIGAVAESFRKHPHAHRSQHPILSFSGVNADTALEAQMLDDPFAPIGVLAESGGHVLLMGVDHTVNTSIHYAEKIAGRKQFIRWALTIDGVRECASWPGCSAGFKEIGPYIDRDMRWVKVSDAVIITVSMERLFEVVAAVIEKDPLALLCSRQDCERCQAVKDTRQEIDE